MSHLREIRSMWSLIDYGVNICSLNGNATCKFRCTHVTLSYLYPTSEPLILSSPIEVCGPTPIILVELYDKPHSKPVKKTIVEKTGINYAMIFTCALFKRIEFRTLARLIWYPGACERTLGAEHAHRNCGLARRVRFGRRAWR